MNPFEKYYEQIMLNPLGWDVSKSRYHYYNDRIACWHSEIREHQERILQYAQTDAEVTMKVEGKLFSPKLTDKDFFEIIL